MNTYLNILGLKMNNNGFMDLLIYTTNYQTRTDREFVQYNNKKLYKDYIKNTEDYSDDYNG